MTKHGMGGRWLVRFAAVGVVLVALGVGGSVAGAEPAAGSSVEPGAQRRGFYLHACWTYEYPFAVRAWRREDYKNMFRLLARLGYNTVMLWPCTEAVPAPMSQADRNDLAGFRAIIDDARKQGLETWLAFCVVGSTPEIAAKPWMQRSLYAHMKTVRLDEPREARAFLEHRAAVLEILNNADGYVTIDGDPGGYPGAKPAEFLKVLLADRQTLDRVGTHPKTQKIVPWIWNGWGRDNTQAEFWGPPVEPHSTALLAAIEPLMPEPWELLPGRSNGEAWANGRVNVEAAKKAGLLGRSTLFCYEAIEFEPTPPAAWLRFADIRRIMKQEMAESPGSRGWFGNSQTPILVIPNLYLFARGAADPAYLDEPDEKVLAELAELLGGPAELLAPAWSCLERGLDRLPPDLPERLRAAKLTGEAASYLPGGPDRYLEVLAACAECRIRVLRACGRPAATPEEAAAAIADATAALVDWWKLTGYRGAGDGTEPFAWSFVHGSLFGPLKAWCSQNVPDPAKVTDLAVKKIVGRGTLDEPACKDRIGELLAR
ncbi:MAG: hypothetical protein JW809_01570 [Pirellulales bacterium]|nr:hypothetical protein [Pirellulales bacterium]